MNDSTTLMFTAFGQLWKSHPSFSSMLEHIKSGKPIVIELEDQKLPLPDHVRELLIEAITPYSCFKYNNDYDEKMFFPTDQPKFCQSMGHDCHHFSPFVVDFTHHPQHSAEDRRGGERRLDGEHGAEHKDDSVEGAAIKPKHATGVLDPSHPLGDEQIGEKKRERTEPLKRHMGQDEFVKRLDYLGKAFSLPRSRFRAAQEANGVVLEVAGGNGASSLEYFAYNPCITTAIITDATFDSITDGVRLLDELLEAKGYHGTKKNIDLTVDGLVLNDSNKTNKVRVAHYRFTETPPLPTEHDHMKPTMMDNLGTRHDTITMLKMPQGMENGPKVPKNVDIYLFPATVDQVGLILQTLNQLHPLRTGKNAGSKPCVDTVFELLGLCSTSNATHHLANISQIFNNPKDNQYKVVLLEHGLSPNTFFNQMAFRGTFLHWSWEIGCCPIRDLKRLLCENPLYSDAKVQVLSPPTLFLATAIVNQSHGRNNDKCTLSATEAHRESLRESRQAPATPTVPMSDFFE